MLRSCRIATGLWLALLVPCAVAEDTVAQLLEKGIYLEETAGDLENAAKVYGQIVAKDKAEAGVVAQAYFRLGTCQLKQNNAEEAAATFKQLVERFPSETQWARKANAELSKLGKGKAGPKVVKTDPAAFKRDVPADLDKITVTFDQPMTDGSWSWTGGGETFPKTIERPSYNADKTVCTLPVKLEPGKVYWIGVNSPSHQNFINADGVPARRYVILFATADADGKPTVISNEMLENARNVNAPPAAEEQRSQVPAIVSTEPEALQRDIPADLDKITVTFDRPMKDGSWSWTGGGETFPESAGKIAYDSRRMTCTMPVKLQPGKVYWVGVNSPSHTNFKSTRGIPAPRYVILFATADSSGKPTEIPEDMLAQAKRINEAAMRAGETSGKTDVSPADQAKAKALAARAWKLWQQQKFQEAEPLFQQSVELNPADPHAWNGLGWAQFNQGKGDDARKAFEQSVRLEPKHAGALNGLGWIAKGKGETDQAIEYWKQAVAALPTGSAALNGLATTYIELEKYDEAAKCYRMWLKAEPGNADAKAGLALAQEKAK